MKKSVGFSICLLRSKKTNLFMRTKSLMISQIRTLPFDSDVFIFYGIERYNKRLLPAVFKCRCAELLFEALHEMERIFVSDCRGNAVYVQICVLE